MRNHDNFQQQFPRGDHRGGQIQHQHGERAPWSGYQGGLGSHGGPGGWSRPPSAINYYHQQPGNPPTFDNWNPRVQLQPYHWNTNAPQAGGGVCLPSIAVQSPYMQPVMMHPQQFHYQQQQYSQQQNHHHPKFGQPHGKGRKEQRAQTQPPSLSLPQAKKKKKSKDIVPALEPMTQDPIVREPHNVSERAEIEAWKAERRKHWPSEANVKKKQQEAASRKARGEVDPVIDTRLRLRDVLAKQREMGLSRKAGTEDLYYEVTRQGVCGRGRGRGMGRFQTGGRMRGGGRGRQTFGWEALLEKSRSEIPINSADTAVQATGLPRERVMSQDNVSGVGTQQEMVLLRDEGLAVLQGYGSEGEAKEDAVAVVVESPKKDSSTMVEGVAKEQEHSSRTVRFGASSGVGGRRGGRANRERGRGRGRGRGQANAQRESWRPPFRPHQPSLLEKLLSKEIMQDRSYILQAFRFIVTNNFFLDHHASGTPLKFPVAAGGPASAGEDGEPVTEVTEGAPLRSRSVKDILASKEGIDIELSESDEEENGVPLEHGDTEDSSSSSDEDEDDGFSHFLNS